MAYGAVMATVKEDGGQPSFAVTEVQRRQTARSTCELMCGLIITVIAVCTISWCVLHIVFPTMFDTRERGMKNVE